MTLWLYLLTTTECEASNIFFMQLGFVLEGIIIF